MNKNKISVLLILFSCCLAFADDIPANWQKIFVSISEGNDNNLGNTISAPIKTLTKAKQMAQSSGYPGFAILLKGGENFTPTIPMTSPILVSYCDYRYRSAFIWDIDKPLLFSSYGNDKLAVLGPGTATSTTSQTVVDPNALQTAICVCYPCKQSVIIENLYIKHWELGGIFPFKYLPTTASNKLTIRNNVFEEIGTMFFPEEKFLQPGESYTIYAADVIQPRTSNNIVISDNIFKNTGNYFDSEHTTPFLMDSFHVFYMGNGHDVTIENNIIISTGGPPVKAKYAGSYNILVKNNTFLYTSPSEQINTVQEGFIRCLENAYIQVENNQFYCPYVWPQYENPETAVAVQSSGDSMINWGANSFYFPYYREMMGSYFTDVRQSTYTGICSRRYYTGSSFIYLDPLNWNPQTDSLVAFSTQTTPDIFGLLDLLYDCRYLGTENNLCKTGWNIEYILGKNGPNIIAYGSDAEGTVAGWLELIPKQMVPQSNTVFSEHFDLGVVPSSWELSFANTTAANFTYTVNDQNNSKLQITRLIPATDQKWTSAFFTRQFSAINDFHIDFKQDWQQDSMMDMPYLQIFLKSAGTIFASVGYEDKSTTEFGHTRVYTSLDVHEILGAQSQNDTCSWQITKYDNLLTIRLNNNVVASVAETHPLDEIVIAVQGRYMASNTFAWQWNQQPILGIDLIKLSKLSQIANPSDADFDGDTDLSDFAFFASHWTISNCSNYKWCNQMDFDFSQTVDFNDFVIMAENWLE